MNKLIYITLFISCILSQSQYNVGDTINEEHLSMTFDTCFGDISEVTFGDYQNSSVIWLNFGATWWGSCYTYLQYGDQVYLDWENDERVQTFIVLDDLNLPYTCNQWASAGMSSSEIISPPIIDDGGPPNDQVIWSWFDWGTSAQYPKNVFIDHEMKVFHIEEIDLDVDQVNYYITQMLDAMPEAVSGCIDSQACNYNPEATQDDESCEYPETNYDCDDNCIGVDIDQDGVCDVDDICPNIYDPWQSDYDNDQLADACEDTDDDNDGNDDCWNLAVGTYIPGNFDSILYFDENSQQLTQNEIAALIASGVCEDTQLAIDNTSIPNDINLLSVYPNPFNPSSNINFFINTPQIITLSIYNLDGQKISNLASEFYNSGHHEIKWSPDISISSGLYIVRLEARNSAINHKLLYLK